MTFCWPSDRRDLAPYQGSGHRAQGDTRRMGSHVCNAPRKLRSRFCSNEFAPSWTRLLTERETRSCPMRSRPAARIVVFKNGSQQFHRLVEIMQRRQAMFEGDKTTIDTLSMALQLVAEDSASGLE